MPTKDIPITDPNLIHLSVPDNFSIGLLHLGKSEICLRITPDLPAAVPAPVPAPTPAQSEIPADVLAWCDKKGITDDFLKALAIVRSDFPDLRKETISLEEHEVLEWAVLIEGQIPAAPEEVAKRTWDCIGRLVKEIPRDNLAYFLLHVHPESE